MSTGRVRQKEPTGETRKRMRPPPTACGAATTGAFVARRGSESFSRDRHRIFRAASATRRVSPGLQTGETRNEWRRGQPSRKFPLYFWSPTHGTCVVRER
jgi:hypothetical protein